MRLRAVTPLTYATRRLMAGDVFEASNKDARLLMIIRKAEALREPVDVPPPPPDLRAKLQAAISKGEADDRAEDELAAARVAYKRALGKRPYFGWNTETLHKKIAEETDQ